MRSGSRSLFVSDVTEVNKKPNYPWSLLINVLISTTSRYSKMEVYIKSELPGFTDMEMVTIKQEKIDYDEAKLGNEDHSFTEDYKIPIEEVYLKSEPDPLSTNTEYSNNDDMELRNPSIENDWNLAKKSLRKIRMKNSPLGSNRVEENAAESALIGSEPDEEGNQNSGGILKIMKSIFNNEENGNNNQLQGVANNKDNIQMQDDNINKYLKMWKILYRDVDLQEQIDIYEESNGNVQQTMDNIRLLNEERKMKGKCPLINRKRIRKREVKKRESYDKQELKKRKSCDPTEGTGDQFIDGGKLLVDVENQVTEVAIAQSQVPVCGLQTQEAKKFSESPKNNDPNGDDVVPDRWRREVVMRKAGLSAGKFDVYYYSPKGKKLRSRNEVENYCLKHGMEIDLSLFKFTIKGFSKSPFTTPKTPEIPKTPKTTKTSKTPITSKTSKTPKARIYSETSKKNPGFAIRYIKANKEERKFSVSNVREKKNGIPTSGNENSESEMTNNSDIINKSGDTAANMKMEMLNTSYSNNGHVGRTKLLRGSVEATDVLEMMKLHFLQGTQKLTENIGNSKLGIDTKVSKMSGEHCIMSIESLRDNDLKEEILYEQKKEVNMKPVEEDFANNEQDPLLTNNEYSNNEDDMRIEDIYRREMSRIYLIEDNGDASPLKHAVIAKYLKMWMMLYPEITVQELRNIYQENKGTVHQAMEKMRQVNRERKLLNNQRRTKTKFYFPKSNGRKYIEGYFWEVTGEEKVLTKQRVEETNKNNEKKENDNKDGDNCQFQDSTSDKYLKMWKVLYPEVDTQEQRKIYIENNGNVPQTMNKIRKMNKERRTKVERRPTTDGLGIWTNGNKPYGPLL